MQIIAKVTATDADDGAHAVVVYSLHPDTDDNFKIDKQRCDATHYK